MYLITTCLGKNGGVLLFFDWFKFYSEDIITKKLSTSLTSSKKYNCLIMVMHGKNSYFIAGTQFPFAFNSSSDIRDLISVVNARLNHYIAE